MDDALKIKAYELLIQDMDEELTQVRHDLDRSCDSWIFAFSHLAKFIRVKHGFDVLRSLAVEIDAEEAKHGSDKGFTDLVECDYGG
ncbi:hypothetical protein EBS40_04170 [bacterium]|nr:hypothetical protein [bacterium]NDG18623.1 hypothetical protein [Betaproteobacteria bacterium]